MRGIHLSMLSPVRIDESEERIDNFNMLNTNQAVNGGLLSLSGSDEIDRPSRKARATNWDLTCLGISMFMHIVDIGLDMNVAIRFLIKEKYTYFAWTLIFIFFPSLVSTFISFQMTYIKQQLSKQRGQDEELRTSQSWTKIVWQWKASYVFVFLLQLAPLLHNVDSVRWALKSRRYQKRGEEKGQRHYYMKMLKEDQDIAFLKVFECFLEAAPQQILQLTILLVDPPTGTTDLVIQIASLFSSLISMGWCVASYHRTIRLAQTDKENIDKTGTALQFFWHFFVTVSRIVSICVVGTMWPAYTGVACILHWAAMTTWLIMEPHGVGEICRDKSRPPLSELTMWEKIRLKLFASILGTVYIFTYLNPGEGRTFLRHLFYYVLCFVENAIAAGLWRKYARDTFKDCWYYELLMYLCVLPFFAGMASMIIYYKCFHPTCRRHSNESSPPTQVADPSWRASDDGPKKC